MYPYRQAFRRAGAVCQGILRNGYGQGRMDLSDILLFFTLAGNDRGYSFL